MIKQKCMGIILAVVVLLAGVAGGVARTSQIAAGEGGMALNPWTVEMLEKNTPARDLSIVMGGQNQYPLISFTVLDLTIDRIKLAIPALDEIGDFGPDNGWKLFTLPPAPKVGTVSAAASHTITNTFIVGWAYQGRFDENIYVYYREFDSQLNFLTEHTIKIINLDVYPGWDLLGKPSLAFDGNARPRLTVTLEQTGLPFTTKIIYAYHSSSSLTHPCDVSPTNYQCDQIATGPILSLSAPILMLDINGSPKIVYQDSNYLMFAYPEDRPQYHPNCGPGGNTWRCIVMTGGPVEGEIGALFSMAVGSEAPHLAYTQKDSLNQVWLHSASFVGSGGNCGYDYALTQLMPPEIDLIPRWKCTQLFSYGMDPLYTAVTVGVDQDNYPVLAFNESAGLNFILTVAFPAERAGEGPTSGNCGPDANTWTCIKVDGRSINTGKNAALALKDDGRGFIVYIEDEEYSPSLKLAFQQMYVFLPMVIR